jgi:predicted nucleic acid-binding protein
VDTDLFFFYLRGGKFSAQAEIVIKNATAGTLQLRTCSETYDDAITALRVDKVPLNAIRDFVSDMKSIPHKALPINAEIAEDALQMYLNFGGRKKLSYFDAFHVSTARRFSLKFLTSDRYILEHSDILALSVKDLSLVS